VLCGIALGVAWFTVFVIAHALLFHLRSVRKRFQAILNLFVSALAGQAISCVIVAAMGAGRIGGVRIAVWALAGTVVMCSFWVLYMPFYYVLAASTSIRTLIAVQHAPRGELSVTQLIARFASPAILRHRLDVMVRYGNVVRQGGGYALTVKGRRTARVFACIKRLWKLGPGG
jgi:hypothetical protein